jgi:hypothetical protein
MLKIKQFIKIVFEYISEMIKNLTPKEKEDVIRDIDIYLALIKNTMNQEETKQQALYRIAKENLGRDITPDDKIPDEVACAENVSAIIKKVLPDFPIIAGTWTLDDYLRKDKRFEVTMEIEPGVIIISPTGKGNGLIRGHCSIVLENGKLASNDSNTGFWSQNYTIESWIKRYRVRGGLPIYCFRIKD